MSDSHPNKTTKPKKDQNQNKNPPKTTMASTLERLDFLLPQHNLPISKVFVTFFLVLWLCCFSKSAKRNWVFSAALHPSCIPAVSILWLITDTDEYDLIPAWLISPTFCRPSSSVCPLLESGVCLWLLKQAGGVLLVCSRAAQVTGGARSLHVPLLTCAETLNLVATLCRIAM